ncbi:MAG: lytic transglycosylase subunit [Sphingomonas bacterium]|nr:lytic transglycosylase domain-containing protein [Sphingomonas bacterium]MDB5689991.1 lytic transglycosylase subunit [Sphingomonas bacterium]
MKQKAAAALLTLGLCTAPAAAATETLPAAFGAPKATAGIPRQLSDGDQAGYRAVFAAIRAADWVGAAALLDAMPDGLLTPIARAELYLAKDSPKVDAAALVALIAAAPDSPEAPQLARLARTRGAETLPEMPGIREMVRLARAPIRSRARSNGSDAAAATLGAEILPLIKDDRPSDAEALLIAAEPLLSSEARTEWRQRVAWSYFLTGDDTAARRLADGARADLGEWAVQADWVSGLAAWRQRDCTAAAQAFSSVAARARDSEMTAAGLFWAARADMACGRPEKVQSRLRTASRLSETFYGLLASGALGTSTPAPEIRPDLIAGDWENLARRTNARRAAALVEIGETALADSLLRHQAKIGDRNDHEALLHLAARLNLPSAQIWLAQNGPAGARLSTSARYPSPGWTPQGGWRVDKALVYAHTLQESQFRTDAVSAAGARGLMQVLPSTAQLIARRRGETVDTSSLYQPAVNMAYGQAYLEQLRDGIGTGGLLPKVIAAYNAGPGSVVKWNERNRDRGDPLLFIESIPFVETRGYVAIVLRNYWMYQRQAGEAPQSLRAMAQYMWPRFPGLPGKTAVRIDPLRGPASAY